MYLHHRFIYAYIVLYGTSMLRPLKTCLAFFPLPYFLYTLLTLTAKSDVISDVLSFDDSRDEPITTVILYSSDWRYVALRFDSLPPLSPTY